MTPHQTENLGQIIKIEPIPEVDVDLTISPTAREVVVSDRWIYNQAVTEAEKQAGDAAATQLVQLMMFLFWEPCMLAFHDQIFLDFTCPLLYRWALL